MNNDHAFSFAMFFVLAFTLAANEFVLKPMGFDAIVELKVIILGLF